MGLVRPKRPFFHGRHGYIMTEEWTSLTDFIDGLVAAGGSPNMADYVYAGGDRGEPADYFRMRYCGRRPHPYKVKECVCGHRIDPNYYIEETTSGRLYNVGSHCVRRFFHGIEKTCTFCGTVHKNRKDNMCKACRKNHVFIIVEFSQKDAAKRLGSRWNPTVGMWWVHPSNARAIEEFGRFI